MEHYSCMLRAQGWLFLGLIRDLPGDVLESPPTVRWWCFEEDGELLDSTTYVTHWQWRADQQRRRMGSRRVRGGGCHGPRYFGDEVCQQDLMDEQPYQ